MVNSSSLSQSDLNSTKVVNNLQIGFVSSAFKRFMLRLDPALQHPLPDETKHSFIYIRCLTLFPNPDSLDYTIL